MKKIMLALACAAAFAVSAEEWGYVGFENFSLGALEYGNGDSVGKYPNSTDGNFLYEASSGSADGSSVVAYDGAPSLPAGSPKSVGENYLSLSTEGGTLWRSLNEPSLDDAIEVENGTWNFGEPVDASEKSIYIDTMVQFTPTEDGSEPDVGDDAKLAIWLNVATDENGASKTNLCVRGAFIDENSTASATTFTIVNKSDIVPGKWYRLTVEAIADIEPDDEYGLDPISGFIVRLDGDVLVADKCTVSDVVKDECAEGDISDVLKNVFEKKVLANINGDADSTLSAVGFKGSGAIDEFVATDVEPSFAPSITTVDFTLAWGEGVNAVRYTIGDGAEQEAVNNKSFKVETGKKVMVVADPDDWYEIKDGHGEFTVTDETTVTVTAALRKMSDVGISGLENLATADVKVWADAKGYTSESLRNCDAAKQPYVLDSFLLNTELLTAAPTLKIDEVAVVDGEDGAKSMKIVVSAKTNEADPSDVDLGSINGELYVTTGDALDTMATRTIAVKTVDDGKAVVDVPSAKFVKASVDVKTTAE